MVTTVGRYYTERHEIRNTGINPNLYEGWVMKEMSDDQLEDIDQLAPFFEATLNSLADVVAVFDVDGQMVYWNDRVNQVTGYRDHEIAEMHPVEFVPEEERGFIRDRIREVRSGEIVTFEVDFLTREGQQIPYEFKGSPLTVGNRRMICGAGRDITERRRFEQKLIQSERKYRRLFEDSQEGIIITTPLGEITDANPELCRLSGYSREELMAMNVIHLYVKPEQRRPFETAMREDGVCRGFEMHARRKDGTMIICQISASARRSSDGETRLYQSFVRDVTAEKRARAALEESEEKFRILAEEALVGIKLIQDGVFRYVNPALGEIFGYSAGELVGQSPREVIHMDDWHRVSTAVTDCIAGDTESAHYKCRGTTVDGDTRIIEVHGSRITFRGEPALIGTVMDITERQRLQREILRIQEEERHRVAQDLHDAVGSHLTGTEMALRSLAERASDEYPELRKDLLEIAELVELSSRDASQLSEGLSPVHLEGVGLASAIGRMVSTAAATAEATFRYEADDDLPELSDEVATHFYWIAQEAVNNARKHGQAETICVRLLIDDHAFVLEVEDDGCGFEPGKQQPHGIGLRSMGYRAELLGGQFTLDSTPGKGTTIRCGLPIGEID